MNRWFRAGLVLVLAGMMITALVFAQQDTGVRAEALSNQVNLRAEPGTNFAQVGQIASGTPYVVAGRSQFFPWLLLADENTLEPVGWVYETLVRVNGDINRVPFSEVVIGVPPTPTFLPVTAVIPGDATATTPPEQLVAPGAVNTPAALVTPSPTIPFNVAGTTQGQINLRYGPGTNYPRIGVANPGDRFQITAYHTQLPWVQIAYDPSPTGSAWILQSLLDIEGNIFSLQAITTTRFDLPTLTPTPSVIQSSNGLQTSGVPLSAEIVNLGNRLWNQILTFGFDPQTNKFASLFLLDLQTGEALTLGENIAYRGSSVNKISILMSLYASLNNTPDQQLAVDIANTMICSENASTNRLIARIGEGDEWRGAQQITNNLQQLGLTDTFLLAPYTVDPANPPTPPAPIPVPQTDADQTKASAEPYNQVTVQDLGWLLGSIYQCAYENSGPLLTQFAPGTFEPRECRQMLHVMSSNDVDGLLKTGVPAEIRVAHKHGWIADTHSNAGIFFTPGGDYVLTMAFHSQQIDATGNRYLAFSETLPVFSEISRTVYNYYNPDNPQRGIREGFIPEAATCNYAGTPLIGDLMQPTWDR